MVLPREASPCGAQVKAGFARSRYTRLQSKQNSIDVLHKEVQATGEFWPSTLEDDLLEALGASQAQIIISAYGTITDFLVRYPGFEVLYEELYTFVYYKCTDNEDDILDGAAAVSCVRHSNKSRLQYSLAGGDGFRRTSVIFSNSFSGGGDKQEKCRMKHGWSQVPSLPRCSSRALQAVRQTCEAEVQTEKCSSARLAEMNSMLQEREKRIAELKERLNTTRERQARQAQQLREKIELLKAAAPPPRRVKEVRNNEQPAGTNTAEGSSQLPRPRLPQRQTSPRRPRVEEKPRLLSSGQTARPDPPHRGGMQAPRHRAEKRRTSPARPTVQPLSPRRCRTPSPRRKTWVKPRALRFGQMAWLAPPMRGGTPPRPKAEEKSRALTIGLKAQTLLRKSDEQPSLPVCDELKPGHRNRVSTQRLDVESKPSGQVASRVKSKAEQQMAKLVQMVKRNKPEYTEQEIRMHLDDLRRSQGGFSSMILRDIVALMLGLLEEKR
ncbi:hypothetical protein HPB52_005768 [Rhipicephalus sanguineus]|uniref:Uncharacterized protein n=1 Tax=Rhipicephalus sanguineus TaxID=34632 RepID=A0A9D4T770_RHISA|nr:hypothetical protein HPB52_005768 [Rhipicephalus sanguineus]